MRKHQDLSRTASVGMFKGGLADASEETKIAHNCSFNVASNENCFGKSY